MKKQSFMLVALFISGTAMAQLRQPFMPGNKKTIDSLFGMGYQFRLPPGNPLIKGFLNPTEQSLSRLPQNFSELYPGATLINKTNRGAIYNMPLDNMAVLIPDMKQLEKMPGSSPDFRVSPQSNMPNPLYPGASGRRKK